MVRHVVAIVLLLSALACPSTALAQGAPFTPLPPSPPEQPPAPTTDTDDDGDGLSEQQQLLIALAGIVLLFGIGWAIVRDARSRAPVEERTRAADGSERPKATKPPPVRRAQQSRAKAKAARRARKRNR